MPIASTVLSHAEGVSDSTRARELYKYYQPSAPITADTCFPAPSPPLEQSSEDHDPRNPIIQSDIASSKISSPDTALTAFCQLVTWRLGAQRAMIGLLDAETQYFVAESTKTVDLVDTANHAPGDDIWMGCSSVSKAGKLCERTIAVAPSAENYPSFIVNDLSKDERFNQLPFVTGPPNLRFYAGVPLITKRGIPIGSLFIVDDFVRDGLSQEEVHFMGTMAKTIMKHFEMVREVEEHRRGMKMSRGLASFVEGRAELEEDDIEAEDGEGTRIAGQFETDSMIGRTKSKGSLRSSHSHQGSISESRHGSIHSSDRKDREHSSTGGSKPEDYMRDTHRDPGNPGSRPELAKVLESDSQQSLGTTITISSPPEEKLGISPSSDASEGSLQSMLCSRAANLIRETFEVDGGCVFYDAQGGFSKSPHERPILDDGSNLDVESQTESQLASGDDLNSSSEAPSERDEISSLHETPEGGKASYAPRSPAVKKVVEILGFSTPSAASIHGDEVPGSQSFKPLQEKDLQTLLRRYPRGKLWTFDSDGSMSSSGEEDSVRTRRKDPTYHPKASSKRAAKTAQANADAKFLLRHFSGVRQLLFVPLWDAGRARWLSGCFVWSTELTRILSKQNELSFLTAFGNSVMAEWSRVDTEIANQKKGDFIGSISHELRSPLHGILASAEFLGDEVESTFQKGMVETISSCGRTLLDTINHVLDYSKINHFERKWQKNKRYRDRRSYTGSLKTDLPMINLYADIDVSVVCEEVVEGVFAGHIFQNGTAANFDMVRDSRNKPIGLSQSTIYEPLLGSNTPQPPEVAVIFDVEPGNYQFTTQPGAFRRVVMNLLGNALKYTSHGYVWISLSSRPMDDFVDPESGECLSRTMVELTVTDTGRGISSEFLRSKLFTPFAQENSLSSGTGLGLAIVRSIVHILEGTIKFDSEVGKGTKVQVKLPLLRELPKHPDSGALSTPKSTISSNHEGDDSLMRLRARAQGQRVSLHGFDIESADPTTHKTGRLLKAAITNFVEKWYGLQVVPLGQKASIIIFNEGTSAELTSFLRQYYSTHKRRPSAVVLCSHTSRVERLASKHDSKSNVGYVVKPVGPLKLGKAIAQCLEGTGQLTPNLRGNDSSGESDLSKGFEEMSVNPKLGEMLDNARMAADSDNARKAIESPTPSAMVEKDIEFPFPILDDAGRVKAHTKGRKSLERIPGLHVTETVLKHSIDGSTSSASDIESSEIQPKLSFLLVDDNAINLTLLSTSISKRPHAVIDKAMDGLAAVNAFSERESGYDIVFMDISMPLLDGFGATKEIRAIEQRRGDGKKALVIALTGLASSDDQTRAASVGVDLFLTKPVSFKEVKRILDNWEVNRGREES